MATILGLNVAILAACLFFSMATFFGVARVSDRLDAMPKAVQQLPPVPRDADEKDGEAVSARDAASVTR